MGYLLFLATVLGSLFVVDCLAHERGWNRHRWRVAAATIGPLAILMLYLVDAVCAVRKMITAPRP